MIKNFPFLQVDAFSSVALYGNPCAIIFDANSLTEETMQKIALEMNLSETSFVLTSEVADFRARYFTPVEEIPLAGHPTIATIFGLIDTGRLSLSKEHVTVTLELKAGVIPVDIHSKKGKVQQITMSQKKPQFLQKYQPKDILPLFNLSSKDLLENVPIQTVSTGTPQLMLPLKDLKALANAQMNIKAYREFKAQADFFSPHLFCVQGVSSRGQTFARHFGVPPDTAEDPFTGSATGAMAAYLWHYGLIKSPKFIAEQGHWMKRPGEANVEVVGTPEDIKTVKVGGSAVTVLQGELKIPC